MKRFRFTPIACLFFILPLRAASGRPAVPSSGHPPVYIVLFTHIEDNCPSGVFGSGEAVRSYLGWRQKLIATAEMFRKHDLQWVFEPDWTFLLAGLAYETDSVTASTGGKSLFRYLREDQGVVIDPHSHENGGYNYTDVAHLLDSLGVGGSTVMGGHIWDPSLPQFQDWDRFRRPVRGSKYPWAEWRAGILMGHGTPNHVNDPHVSGVWRPRDRDHFFEDDPDGNIVAVGQYKETQDDSYGSLARYAEELAGLVGSGTVPAWAMLTLTTHLSPSELSGPHAFRQIEDSILVPLAALQAEGRVKVTDFTTLVEDWRSDFGSAAYVYDPAGSTAVRRQVRTDPEGFVLEPNRPNPFNPSTTVFFSIPSECRVKVAVLDASGREVAVLADGPMRAGRHSLVWNAAGLGSGVYFCRMQAGGRSAVRKMAVVK